MIFLFFKPSLALLEAELVPFKDWEEIEFSNVANFFPFLKALLLIFLGRKTGIFPVLQKLTHMGETYMFLVVDLTCQPRVSR